MIINQIELKNFRNYEEEKIKFASGTNVFIGQNAQGKTNILEAIYLCTSARSHRTGKDAELIKDGHDYYKVKLDYDGEEIQNQTLEIKYETKPRLVREVRYGGIKQDRISDFFGLFHAVIFAPEDLMLIKDGPAVRRRFLDVLISQIKPLYFKNLQFFQHYLKQRNHLLKILKEINFKKKISPESYNQDLYDFNLIQLDIWTEKLAEIQTEIIQTRQEYVDKIQAYASESLLTISNQKEALEIIYKSVSHVDTRAKKDLIYKQLLKRYDKQREDDINRGNTGSGTHRDDLDILVNKNLLKERGSQGQQRSAVLSIKLAELKIIEYETNEKPVLLLDDVMSELDEYRREHLLSDFEKNQVFITCTELNQIYPNFSGKLVDKNDENGSKYLSNISEDDNNYIHFFKIDNGTVKAQILL